MTGLSGRAGARIRWSFAIAAWLLICQCAAMPAVSRALDRLSLHDHAAGFRYSRNLERPLEKQAPPSLGAVATFVAASPQSSGDDRPAPYAAPCLSALCSTPAGLRAPPAR